MNSRVGTVMRPEYRDVMSRLPALDLRDVPALRATLAALKPSGESPVDSRVSVRDIEVPGPAGAAPVRVRLYTPVDRAARSAILFCHGGGFVLGSLDTEHERCLRFAAEAGVVVLSPDYRLAPEHPHPAAHEDCYAVLRWLSAQADMLGVDRKRTAVGGVSAGAALAFGVALRARDECGPELAGMVLVSPVADIRMDSPSIRAFWNCAGWNGAATGLMWRHYLPDREPGMARYAVPLGGAALAGLPPTLIVLADLDPLHDQGLELAARMRDVAVLVDLREFTGVPHGFDAFCPAAPESVRSLGEQVRFLRQLATAVPTTHEAGGPTRSDGGVSRAGDVRC